MRFGTLCEAVSSPLSHRMPCFQQDFGKRTRPPNLPRAPSTESACSPTWRSKRWSTRTEKTLYPLQGKRKVLSILVLAVATAVPGAGIHCCLAVLVLDTRSEGSHSTRWGSAGRSRAAGAEDEGLVYLPWCLPCCSGAPVAAPWPVGGYRNTGIQEHSAAKGSLSSSLGSQGLWVHSGTKVPLPTPQGLFPVKH